MTERTVNCVILVSSFLIQNCNPFSTALGELYKNSSDMFNNAVNKEVFNNITDTLCTQLKYFGVHHHAKEDKKNHCSGETTSIAQYYISLLSGMRNIDDRDHLVGQLTRRLLSCFSDYCTSFFSAKCSTLQFTTSQHSALQCI